MSNDIKAVWDSDLAEGDFSFDDAAQDLDSDTGLETAVLISLFTDRRAKEDDVLPDSSNLDRRGWWGDLGSPEVDGDQIGSRLWLLSREKTLEAVLIRAKEYAQESLAWLMDDGVAESIEVETERQGVVGSDRLALLVQIFKPGGVVTPFKYELQWITQGAQ